MSGTGGAEGTAGAGAPRILCVAGSPRRHGNSEHLLDRCVAGIRDAGGQPDVLAVADARIKPCSGCNACSLTGECVIRDGMREVYARLDAADGVVVSSPVYFATVPAVLKAFYDRMQPYWARVHVLGEPRPDPRPGAFLVVRGGGDPYGFQAAVYTTRSVFAVLGLGYDEELKVEGPDSPSEIGKHPGALEKAAGIGARLVSAVDGADRR